MGIDQFGTLLVGRNKLYEVPADACSHLVVGNADLPELRVACSGLLSTFDRTLDLFVKRLL